MRDGGTFRISTTLWVVVFGCVEAPGLRHAGLFKLLLELLRVVYTPGPGGLLTGILTSVTVAVWLGSGRCWTPWADLDLPSDLLEREKDRDVNLFATASLGLLSGVSDRISYPLTIFCFVFLPRDLILRTRDLSRLIETLWPSWSLWTLPDNLSMSSSCFLISCPSLSTAVVNFVLNRSIKRCSEFKRSC